MATCPYHNQPTPCGACFIQRRGAFAHQGAAAAAGPVPRYVPPHRRPVHLHQERRDTCAIACCTMVGIHLRPGFHGRQDLVEEFMTDEGIYLPARQSLFHALGDVFKRMHLPARMVDGFGMRRVAAAVNGGSLIVMETGGHVIVVFAQNVDGSFVIGDPAMRRIEMSVPRNDYRLTGATGRVWEVRRGAGRAGD